MVDTTTQTRVIEEYTLSPMQQGMLYHWLRDPRAGVDLEQIACTLDSVDVPVLKQAWELLARRHTPLRTGFRWRDVDAPVQGVFSEMPLVVHEADLRGIAPDEQARRVEAYLATDRCEGFDLAAPPLFRLAFFRTGDRRHEFVWTFPHILLDGRSFVLLLRELLEIYCALEDGREPTLPETRPYRDFIHWLERQPATPGLEFWTRTLAGFDTPSFPDIGTPSSNTGAPTYAEQAVRLSRDDTSALREFVRRHDLTVNTMVQGAWALLLGRYCTSEDVIFGATRACRRTALDGDPATDQMVGLFINTLPVRVRIRPDESVVEWLKQVRSDQVAVRAVEHTSLTQVQSAVALPPGTPLFDTLMVFENQQQATSFDSIDPRFRDFRLIEKNTFPLSLHAYGEDELLLRLEYWRTRFDDAAITRMLGHLATLLREMVASGNGPTSALEMLSPAERHTLLVEWNDTDANFPEHATIHGLVEAQARRRPDAIALECVDKGTRVTLTYGELDRRANRVAWTLVNAGVAREDRVAICLDRSLSAVVAILGVLKAGGAYVPIDPTYPDDRVEFTVRDSEARFVLTEESVALRLAGLSLGDRAIDVERAIVAGNNDDAPPVVVNPRNLAYVIYTSGSTGRPKGVMVEHRNVTRLILNDRTQFDFTERDVWTVFHSFAFDFSVWELYGALALGGRAVIVPRSIAQSPTDFLALLEDTATTVLNQVPSAFYALMHEAVTRASPPRFALRYVIFGGEALNPALLRDWAARWPSIRLINMFGITETTVHVTYKEIGDAEIAAGISNVGRPIPTLTTYVLDALLRPVPVGVIGEICVGGLGVARGYLNRPDLSGQRFVADPFGRGERLYRSGDLGRVLPNGEIEYIGRRDHQVKLRGFRIEVGEIEAALNTHPAVRHAAIILRTDPGIEPRLVAYYVQSPGAGASVADLRRHLGGTLPAHMVPSAFVALPALPLTSSGKLDRKALPVPELDRTHSATLPPRDEIESRVLRIWEQVLGVKNLGISDRFNDVGGHSLVAVRVFQRIRKEFGVEIPLASILTHDTVEQLASLLRNKPEREAWSCVVRYGTVEAGDPIFCFHGGTGSVLMYQGFAKELGDAHPVYGIQAVGNWGEQEPFESIDEMARYYVGEMLNVHPRGPYILFGASMGGIIALEVARILIDMGHEVRLLALYDSQGLRYPQYTLLGRIAKFARDHGGIELSRLRQIFTVELARPLSPRSGIRFGKSLIRNVVDTTRWWYDNTRRDYLYWKFEHKNPPRDFSIPANLSRFRLTNRRVMARYQFRYFPGRITYFRAQHKRPGIVLDPTNGWNGLSAELDVHDLPMGHTGALFHPGVVKFAQLFRVCLGE